MLPQQLMASVFILGGGATGLLMSVELAKKGFAVVLAERREKLAHGPSTHNEGMLHRGTYHAAAIRNRAEALEVATRCAKGYARILEIAPEAIEDTFDRSFVLFKDSTGVDEICRRWTEAGVPFTPITRRKYQSLEPDLNVSVIDSVFEVEDRSINPRAIYRNLARRAAELGVLILTQTQVELVCPEQNLVFLRVEGEQQPLAVSASVCVCTAGAGIKPFFSKTLGTDVPLRFWKSHLLDAPRVSRHNLFFTHPGGITMMHHGAWSIAGLNSDAVEIPEPSEAVTEECVQQLRDGIAELFPRFDRASAIGRACTKVDVGRAIDTNAPSRLKLSFSHGEPLSGHLWVIPGKMTEVPVVADALVALLHERLQHAVHPLPVYDSGCSTVQIAERPIDQYGPPRYVDFKDLGSSRVA